MKLIKTPTKGMNDYLPSEVALREYVKNVIISSYSADGFCMIETPAVEHIENLTGKNGGENEKLIFKIMKRGEKLANASTEDELCDSGLRYDLTVPLSRYYANNSAKLPSPFLAMQIGNVWRADRPQKGRYRQFTQCDIDILGDSTQTAEITLISSTAGVLRKLGFDNFTNVLYKNPLWSKTFISLFIWTIIWAFFATFLNYILGMILAMIINKKGIKLKGMWRTIFVITIAVPQFVSLMLMSKLLADTGAINNVLQLFGREPINFLTNGTIAKIVVIVINLWVGIPYTMLQVTGILQNIPAELYESAKVDGAGDLKCFTKITLPCLKPTLYTVAVLSLLNSFKVFREAYLVAGDYPDKSMYLLQHLFNNWFRELSFGKMAAASVLMAIVIFILIMLLQRAWEKQD